MGNICVDKRRENMSSYSPKMSFIEVKNFQRKNENFFIFPEYEELLLGLDRIKKLDFDEDNQY